MWATARSWLHAAAPRAAGARRTAPEGALAITLDDGPDPEWTPRALDVLAELDARATFFLVGRRAEARPDLVQRIVGAGHAVGSHTHTHPEPWSLRPRALLADYRRGRAAVEQAAGRRTSLFRPPQGHFGVWETAAVRCMHLDPWLWTTDGEDWRPEATATSVAAAVADPRSTDVVLLHDSLVGPAVLDRTPTLEALPGLVAAARARGLKVVTLEEDR